MSSVLQNRRDTVLNYYGLNEPPIVTDFIHHNGKDYAHPPMEGVSANTTFGVEVELEKCNDSSEMAPTLWTVEGDGSLKDHGLEFISKPIRGSQYGKAFNELVYLFEKNPKSVFSHRCSIHVHVGVGELTIEQLIVMVSAYIVSEKLFFSFAGANAKRHNNSYCFPIVGSGANCHMLNKAIICNPDSLKKFKYCALNVYHLRDYGTLEFRHHAGTKEIAELRAWMNAIGRLYTYASTTTLREHVQNLEEVSENKNYCNLISKILGNTLPGAESLSRSETRLMILASKHFISDLF